METETNTQPLDENSDRYRVCPYCRNPFMASHRSREFCGKKCHDNFHNEKKLLLSHGGAGQPSIKAPIINTRKSEDRKTSLKNNIDILSKLTVNRDDSTFYLSELIESGFEFRAYTIQFKILNTIESFCVEYAPYQLFLVAPDKVIIHLKTKTK